MSAVPEALPTSQDTVEQMAFAIADRAARLYVELERHWVIVDGIEWIDLSGVTGLTYDDAVLALRYMQARGDALPYRVICHPNYPFLRRFELRR